MYSWTELSFISQEDDDLFPADGRAALDKLSEEENDSNEVSIFTITSTIPLRSESIYAHCLSTRGFPQIL